MFVGATFRKVFFGSKFVLRNIALKSYTPASVSLVGSFCSETEGFNATGGLGVVVLGPWVFLKAV